MFSLIFGAPEQRFARTNGSFLDRAIDFVNFVMSFRGQEKAGDFVTPSSSHLGS
jgi:hypothetical protein